MNDQDKLDEEIRRVTGAIQNAFTVDGDLEEGDVEHLHDMLKGCVVAVNKRLRVCDELLRNGLRIEAVQECEKEPHLLDMVTELDFPEWEAWADYVRQHRIPPQPRLLVDVAGELNEAYVKSQSLEEVMRTHRLLALARAPLPDRLRVLRLIASRDPENHVWADDVDSYERERLRQIDAEAQKVAGNDDLRGAARLRKELEGEDWRTAPPSAVIQLVVETHERLVREDAYSGLTDLAPQIDDAFSNFDVAAAKGFRVRWDELAERAELRGDDPVAESVQQAFDWLDEEQAEEDRKADHEMALLELDAGLENDATDRQTLDRLISNAERFDESVPERFVRRYRQRVDAIELAKRRRSTLFLTATVVTLLLVAAGTAFVVRLRMQQGEMAAFRAVLTANLDQGDFNSGIETYDRQTSTSPHFADDPTVQSLHTKLLQLRDDDIARADRVSSLLERVFDLVAGGLTWSEQYAANESLAEAERDVRTESEKNRYADAKDAYRIALVNLQNQTNAAFDAEYAPLGEACRDLGSLQRERVEKLLLVIDQLSSDPAFKKSTSGNKGLLPRHKKDLESRLAAIQRQERRAASLSDIIAGVGRIGPYRTGLKRYVSRESSGDRRNGFKKTLDADIALLERLEEWSRLSNQWNQVTKRLIASPEEALEVRSRLQDQFAGYPGVAEVGALQGFLEAVPRRDAAIAVLRDKVFGQTVCRTKIGQTNAGEPVYYTERLREGRDSTGTFRMVMALDKLIPEAVVERKIKSAQDKLSPPATIAAGVERILRATKQPYERKVCAILHILLEAKAADPVFRASTASAVISVAKAGSPLLDEHLTQISDQITAVPQLGDLNWIDPRDPVANKARGRVIPILDRIRGSNLAPRRVYSEKIRPEIKKIVESPPVLIPLTWYGILLQDEDDGWSCGGAKAELASGAHAVLYAVSSDESGVARFEQIGRVSQNGARVDEGIDIFYEGRPVFVRSDRLKD